jgi:4-amino-4-deoxy-L-arabinose transferase-like glycosyltransferase
MRRALIAIWVLFILKGIFYCVLFPIWEGYDEYAHFGFIQFVATHHELPVPDSVVSREVEASLELVPLPWLLREWLPPHVTHDAYWRLTSEERALRQQAMLELPVAAQTAPGQNALYEGKQGPLYYWLMAPLEWLLQGAPLATRVLLFRIANILLASALIPLTFASGRLVFRSEYAALCACVLLAAMPELLIDSSRVGNQTLAMVLYGVLTYLSLEALDGKPRFLLIGAALGLILLSKAYALAAIPAVCFVLISAVRRTGIQIRSSFLAAGSLVLAAGIAGWWYLRNIQLTGSLVWVDGAPSHPIRKLDLIRYAMRVHWGEALDSLIGSHLWYGNWSFLAVRSWMYRVFEGLIVLIAIGLIITVLKSLRSGPDALPLRHVIALLMLFAGFLAAMGYHVLINFINSNVSATCGWYLYAVAVPEALLVIAGLRGFGRRKNVLFLMLAGAFVALELYATQWVLIPYYTGLIAHTPSGALQSFHPGRVTITFPELLTRMHVNRPAFVTNGVVLLLWLCYLLSTTGLFYIAARFGPSVRSPAQSLTLTNACSDVS